MKRTLLTTTLSLIIIFSYSLLISYCGNKKKENEETNMNQEIEIQEEGNNEKINKSKTHHWYEGGTLHKSLISEWRTSLYSNKLATCADWMAVVDNTITMNELRKRSESLLICIDEAVAMDNNGQQISGNLKVTHIAAGCVSLLNF